MSVFFRRPEARAITELPWNSGGDPLATHLTWESTISVVPVFAAIRLISESIASLPLQQYRKDGATRTPMPLAKIFTPRTGSVMSWVQQPLVSLLMRGNAYGLRSGFDNALGGMSANVDWVHPDHVRLTKGEWFYKGRPTDPGQMVHIPGLPVPGSTLGVSPLSLCRTAIAAGSDGERFAATWLQNRARPSMVFRNGERTLKPEEAASVKERMKATVKAGEPLVVGKDWDVTMLSLSAEDAGFVQSARLTATQVATVFGIPPHMIGGDSGGSLTYSTVELNQLQFLTNTLRPWITRLEAALSDLLPKPHYVRFNVDALLRADTKTRHEVYQIDRTIGLKNIDELRALEEEQPLPDGQGADYTPLGQMGPARAAVGGTK